MNTSGLMISVSVSLLSTGLCTLLVWRARCTNGLVIMPGLTESRHMQS